MKYIILGIAMLFSITWHWAQTVNTEKSQYTQFHIEGKVIGLDGNMVLKIEDNYLSLASMDRFTFVADATAQDQLTMQIINQPDNHSCELLKTSPKQNKIKLNISCQKVTGPFSEDAIVGL